MKKEKEYIVGIWTWKRLAILFASGLISIFIIIVVNI